METTFFLLLLSAALLTTKCTEPTAKKTVTVPPKIQAVFASHFPGIPGALIEWEELDGKYEAEFRYGEKETLALFDKTGALLETEITIAELPASASAYFAEHNPDAKVKDVARIISDKGVIAYRIQTTDKILLFDGAGSFVR
jgi:hypothetical protein